MALEANGITMDGDLDAMWRAVGGGALVAAALTLARMLLEQAFRQRDRARDQVERSGAFERDAEARLERLLQDRLCEVDRRLERSQDELDDERQRRVEVERAYAALRAEHAALVTMYCLLLKRRLPHQRTARGEPPR